MCALLSPGAETVRGLGRDDLIDDCSERFFCRRSTNGYLRFLSALLGPVRGAMVFAYPGEINLFALNTSAGDVEMHICIPAVKLGAATRTEIVSHVTVQEVLFRRNEFDQRLHICAAALSRYWTVRFTIVLAFLQLSCKCGPCCFKY